MTTIAMAAALTTTMTDDDGEYEYYDNAEK